AVTDPRHRPDAINIVLGLFPLCAALGYLTPMLVDQHSAGFPDKAGKAYAVNIIGCILGPLCAGYILLPALGVKWSLILLALPFTVFFLARLKHLTAALPARLAWSLISAGAVVSSILCITYEDLRIYGSGGVLRRDHTATVISYGE